MRTLVVTLRSIHRGPAFASLYEFEDVLVELLGADLVQIERSIEDRRVAFARSIYQAGRSVGLGPDVVGRLARVPRQTTLDGDGYDLVIAVLTNFYDLFTFEQLGGWDTIDAPRVCFVSEPWPANLGLRSAALEPVHRFDRWYSGLSAGVDSLAEHVEAPVDFLPVGVDSLTFGAAALRERPVRVLNLGRRDERTHAALAASAADPAAPWWYWFDTVSGQTVADPAVHRRQLARAFGAASFSITNRAKFDQPEVIGTASEVPGRFFEALASGAVCVGDVPPGSGGGLVDGVELIVQAPASNGDVVDLLSGLEADPDTLEERRLQGRRVALGSHDWAHRITRILDDLGLERPPELEARLSELDELRRSL